MKGRKEKFAVELGIKSDPIEYRYSFEWLFALMRDLGVRHLQLGSFFELYHLEDGYFLDLREKAESFGVAITSVFTAHRELGGFFAGDPRLVKVARANYERLIRVASLLGAKHVGSNPGAVYRDRMEAKAEGIRTYIGHLEELSGLAQSLGLEALTIEPMSATAEPPTTPGEILSMMTELSGFHARNPGSSVPFYLCGDISHGFADRDRKVIHGNLELFRSAIPWMGEFHIKNTDAVFGSTFGFSAEERERGIVDVPKLVEIVRSSADLWPVDTVVGYLEIGGPKLGRDYSDYRLGSQLADSIRFIQEAMK
jgi:sugar phosphate isomerase/epimerase